MRKTALVFTPKYCEHNTGVGHPENSKRLQVILDELQSLDLLSRSGICEVLEPTQAGIETLKLVHTHDHIQLVKRMCEHGGGVLDLGDTVASPESYEVARYAVGGAIKAVDAVLSDKFKNAFALIRPPGHHAGRNYAMGFCLFNNVAIAATYIVKKLHFKRVLVLDIDSHHGNGTQEIFYETRKVLYLSLHEDPREFPGTGFIDETGEGEGVGYNVNIAFPYRVSDKTYIQALDTIVVPIIEQYNPQFILVSAGYDGHSSDPVGRLNLSSLSYRIAFKRILGLASALCEDRLVALLEGGYNLKNLGKLVAMTLSKMAGFPYSMVDKDTAIRPRAEKQAEKTIEAVKEVQSAFWSLC
ncbi:MAG: histone deacetylase [Candidatus Bathyarchaeota archaeon]|nr:histone deacetylase [Candidatus Bathyarchaeota archaeon]